MLLEGVFTVVFGNSELLVSGGLSTLVSKEVSSLVSWHEGDTSSSESLNDIEDGVLLVHVLVPVESCSVCGVEHETISVGSVLEGDGVSGSINTLDDSPDVDPGGWGVVGEGADVGEVVSGVLEGSEFVAAADSHTSKDDFSLGSGSLE